MINLNNLKKQIFETRTQGIFGVPILVGWSGVRNIACQYFKHHPKYKTEYCQNPEYVEKYVLDRRGIVKGCETCPLFVSNE